MLKINCLASCILVLCWNVNAQEIDSKKVVNDALTNGKATYARMKDYAFDLRISFRMFDQKARVKETSVYTSPAPLTREENESGNREFILIEKNGKSLSDDKVQRQRVAAKRRIEKIEEKQALSTKSTPGPQPGYFELGDIRFGKELELSPSVILSKCAFTAPVLTSMSGRSSIQLDFTSCSTDGLQRNEMYISKLAGRVWIDEVDKVLSRLEAWIPDPKLANPSNHPQFIYEQMKVDSNWFPKLGMIDGSTPFLVNLFTTVENIEFKIEFENYKRYQH